MWIFTTGGYVSAVQDKNDPDILVIRARDRQSLETLADGAELVGEVERPVIIRGAGTDYPYRLSVSRAAFIAWVAHEITHYLTYKNFKDAAEGALGKPWHDTLSAIWWDTHHFTDEEGERFSPYLQSVRKPKGARKAWRQVDTVEPDAHLFDDEDGVL